MKNNKTLLFLMLAGQMLLAQKTPARFALLNATAHLGNGKVIESALITVSNGTIELVSPTKGLKFNHNQYDTVFDLDGKHVYPALINCNNILGLHDAEAIRATRDFSEVGYLNPHIRALIAYNTDNQIIPTVKTNGVLYTQCTPRGGLISGSSSLMALEGWNWEDAVLKADDGIHVNFPKLIQRRRWNETEEGPDAGKKYQEEINSLDKFFNDTKSYYNTQGAKEKNLRFEAMQPVLAGHANLYLHADKAKDILSAINFVLKHNIKKPVIVGGKESHKVTQQLRKHNIPVMLNRVHDLPDRSDESVDISFELPYLLQKDSVLFCLQLEGDMEAMQSRNLSFNAGTAVAYGLTKEEALQSITLNAARILGVENMIGSLEKGKLASLIVSDGDILDMTGNNIILAWIAGKPVNLVNKQTELYLKYKTKYGIK